GPQLADRHSQPVARCPKCACDDESMLEETPTRSWFCNVCAHEWEPSPPTMAQEIESLTPDCELRAANCELRFSSLEDLIARTGVRRDELATLAEIGALNAFGYDRRSALWQIERAVRPSGELFEESSASGERPTAIEDRRAASPSTRLI